MTENDEYLTLEQLAARLGWEPKTIQNKIAKGVFKKGIHYAEAPELPRLFKWSAIIDLYEWDPEPDVPMARRYKMK